MERAEERAEEDGLQEYSQECLQLAEEIRRVPQVSPQIVVVDGSESLERASARQSRVDPKSAQSTSRLLDVPA